MGGTEAASTGGAASAGGAPLLTDNVTAVPQNAIPCGVCATTAPGGRGQLTCTVVTG